MFTAWRLVDRLWIYEEGLFNHLLFKYCLDQDENEICKSQIYGDFD